MYADDTTIFTIGKTTDLAIDRMNTILKRMFHWCIDNRMTAHPDKCEFMILRRSRFVGPMAAVRFGTGTIKQVRHTRCLGVKLDDKLCWSPHVSEISKSFVQKLNLLKALRFLPQPVRLDFYFKVIMPSVTYGLLIWGSCNKTLMDSLQRIHFRAARIIYNLPWDTPRNHLITQHKWKPITHWHSTKLGTFVHKCIFDCDAHYELQQMFNKRNVKYKLRGTNILKLPRHNTNYGKNSIRRLGVNLWNKLPDYTRTICSNTSFKHELKKNLNWLWTRQSKLL